VTIRLYDKDSGKLLGDITEDQLRQLQSFLEEEDEEDSDYWINPEAIDYMEEEGLDPAVVKMLRDNCTSEDGMEIEWREEE